MSGRLRGEEQGVKPLFTLGYVVATPGAPAAIEKAGRQPGDFLARHVSRNWLFYLSFTSLYTSVMNRLLLAGVSPFVVASYGAVRFAARISSSDLP